MGQINSIPGGLLAFLGLKQEGRNPGSLGDIVLPSLRMDPFYMAANAVQTTVTSVATGNAQGFQTDIFTVPQAQCFVIDVLDSGATAGGVASPGLRFHPYVKLSAAQAPITIAWSNQVVAAASEVARCTASYFTPPLVLGPGTVLGMIQLTDTQVNLASSPASVTLNIRGFLVNL